MENQGYNFEEFTAFKGKFSSKISLGAGGFGFSSGFYNKYNLKNSVGLKLFYDKDNKVVGFKFLESPESGMIKLKKRQIGGYVAARSFLGKYIIEAEKYGGRYDPKEITDEKLGKIYVIELKEHSMQSG